MMKEWIPYLDGHFGRHDFQIDLALSLMNYGIGLQWDGESAERPNFMQQDPFVPCETCIILLKEPSFELTPYRPRNPYTYCNLATNGPIDMLEHAKWIGRT
jgi:hypothetical protein